MNTYLNRISAGDHESVWEELLGLGDSIRGRSLFAMASAVARETMNRVLHNADVIVRRLEKAGHRFGVRQDGSRLPYYKGPIVPPTAESIAIVDELEHVVGPIPLSIRAFWEVVGAVDLTGFHPDLPDYSDPLLVYPPERAYWGYKEWVSECEEDGVEDVGPYRIVIAPDYKHKDDVSGGAPYVITLPNSDVDARLENEWHNTTFVNYLRICFRWGGFPGIERLSQPPPKAFATLGEALLPI